MTCCFYHELFSRFSERAFCISPSHSKRKMQYIKPINTTSNKYNIISVFAGLKTSMCLSTMHIWCLSNASHILVVSDIRYKGVNRILRNCYALKIDGTPWCWMVTSSTHLSPWGKFSVSTKTCA